MWTFQVSGRMSGTSLCLNICISHLTASLSAINSTPDLLKMTHFHTVSIVQTIAIHNRSCNLFKCQNNKTAAGALTAVEEQFIPSTTNFHFLLFQNIFLLEYFQIPGMYGKLCSYFSSYTYSHIPFNFKKVKFVIVFFYIYCMQ